MEWLFSVVVIKLYLLVVQSYSAEAVLIAFRDRSVDVACVIGHERSIVESLSNLTITWRDGSGHEIVQNGDRYHVTEYGDLTISRVRLSDSGEYTCNLTGSGGGEVRGANEVHRNFTRRMMAASLPRIVSVDILFYEVANCSGQQVTVKKRQITWELCQSAKPERCRFNVEYTCFRRYGRNELVVNISQGVASVDVSPDNTECGEKCLTEALVAKLQQNNATVSRVIEFEQRRIPIYNTSPLLMRHGRQRVYYTCEPGYEIRRRRHLCLPCKPGFFLPVDKQRCRPCPANTFQSAYGAIRCLPCPPHKTALREGAMSEEGCRDNTGTQNNTMRPIDRVREYVRTHIVIVALFALIFLSMIFTISALVVSCRQNKPRGYITIAQNDTKVSKGKDFDTEKLGLADGLTISSDSDENDIFTQASPIPVKGKTSGEEVTKWRPLLWRRSESATGSGDASVIEKPVLLPFPPGSFRREQVGEAGGKPRDVEGEVTEERKLKPTSRWAVRGRQELAARDRRSPRRELSFNTNVTSPTSVTNERRVSMATVRAYDAAIVNSAPGKTRSEAARLANKLSRLPSINDCVKTLSSYNQATGAKATP